MKRRVLIAKIIAGGAVFVRHGGNHDIYKQPKTKVSEAVPRHREINENLARKIIQKLQST